MKNLWQILGACLVLGVASFCVKMQTAATYAPRLTSTSLRRAARTGTPSRSGVDIDSWSAAVSLSSDAPNPTDSWSVTRADDGTDAPADDYASADTYDSYNAPQGGSSDMPTVTVIQQPKKTGVAGFFQTIANKIDSKSTETVTVDKVRLRGQNIPVDVFNKLYDYASAQAQFANVIKKMLNDEFLALQQKFANAMLTQITKFQADGFAVAAKVRAQIKALPVPINLSAAGPIAKDLENAAKRATTAIEGVLVTAMQMVDLLKQSHAERMTKLNTSMVPVLQSITTLQQLDGEVLAAGQGQGVISAPKYAVQRAGGN